MRYVALATVLVLVPLTAAAVEPVEVSPERGLFEDAVAFPVELTCATPGATITYTLDGSDPRTSPSALTGPPGTQVMIDPNASLAPGVVLRAYSTFENDPPGPLRAHTYIFLPDVLTQPAELPGWQTYDYNGSGGPARHDYEMDPAIVDDPAYADEMVAALTEIPTMCLSAELGELWSAYRGDAEIMASIELIFPEGDSEDTTGGIERHSHDRVKNSIRLSFKSEYEDPKWSTDLLQRGPQNGASATDKFDRMVLRGGNNRSWARNWNPDRTTYATDQWIRDTTIELSGVGSHGTFVHLYLNGVYFGLYNPVERLDEWFTSAYMGGSDEDWFAISHAGPKGGDPARFDYLSGPLVALDMAELANYQELREYVDVDLLADYLLVHWYAGVRDWPQNNWWGGNRNVPASPFMFFTWDGEWSFGVGQGSPDQPQGHPDFVAEAGKDSNSASARVFNSAKDSPEFLIAFADRAYRALYNDGALRDDRARARWQALNDHLRTPVVAESARWGDAVIGGSTRTRDEDWQAEVDFQDAYMDGAAASLISALRAEGYYPLVDPPVFYDGLARIEVTSLELEPETMFTVHVELDGGAGTLYYTVDGTDPRAVGGQPVGQDGGVAVDVELLSPAVLRARTLDGNEWSALHLLELEDPAAGDGDGDGDGDGGGDGDGDTDGSGDGDTGGDDDGDGTDGGADGGTSAGVVDGGGGEGCSCTSGSRDVPPIAILSLVGLCFGLSLSRPR
ncbi:CotH protein [Enhygromyxa salina]|uniref:CotH protein n=1 Tax=Enhygromyxa salina TaxID=215803 RepID=A0A2S9YHC7_9BACT|nr:CotH kinase family protein [Enhygromyxa salina]PRQ04510.1 CotH protein [Enhygromyxa salina]